MGRSKPRIGLIAGNRILRGLSVEAQIFPLSKSNYFSVLRHGKIDLILIEISSATKVHLEKSDTGDESIKDIRNVVSLAKEISIPSVAWITNEDSFSQFKSNVIKLFDTVFCVSKELVRQVNRMGLEAHLLPPCIQPAYFNPIKESHTENKKAALILIDEDEYSSNSIFYEGIATLGLQYKLNKIYKKSISNEEISHQASIPELGANLEWNESARKSVFESVICYVSADSDRNKSVDRLWVELEAAACGVFVVHIGDFQDGDPISKSSIRCQDTPAALTEIIRVQKDAIYRRRIAHKAWRQVTLNHTFAIRLATICQTIGLSRFSNDLPKVSIIAPTIRKNNINNLIKTFNNFEYIDKELIIVYNGDESITEIRQEFDDIQQNLKILSLPSDLFSGAAMNLGCMHATGFYCFRVDDDDIYGKYYVLDMVLQAQATGAAFFGKPPAPVVEESSESVYIGVSDILQSTINVRDLTSGQRWIGGNSMAFKRNIEENEIFSNFIYGAADTAFQLNISDDQLVCICVDGFNLIAQRSKDISSHTWRSEFLEIVKNRQRCDDVSELIV
jgi:hypothetical protein